MFSEKRKVFLRLAAEVKLPPGLGNMEELAGMCRYLNSTTLWAFKQGFKITKEVRGMILKKDLRKFLCRKERGYWRMQAGRLSEIY